VTNIESTAIYSLPIVLKQRWRDNAGSPPYVSQIICTFLPWISVSTNSCTASSGTSVGDAANN